MSWMRTVRALGTWLGGRPAASTVEVAEQTPRSFFVGIGGRPMRLTVSAPTPDALVDATEAGELPIRKAAGALQLRGLARVNGQLIALHDVDRMRASEGRPEDREAVSS
jgi:hypothetical protein